MPSLHNYDSSGPATQSKNAVQTTHKTLIMKKIILTITGLSFLIFLTTLNAQVHKKAQDKAAIKAMLGCYDVSFKYTETFAPEVDYEKAYDYTSAALEWAQLVEETEDKIVIQHLLLIGDSMIIKHWRQDWIYQAEDGYRFDRDNQWVYESSTADDVKGTWTQNVYQVDDSPRYSGRSTWTHVDGISAWYHKADSPLPRREYTKRDDYNVMKRGNRVQILDYGWLHEQDNDKVIRTDTLEDQLLVQEKGYNTYTRVPSEKCEYAETWWKDNKTMWQDVRAKWASVYDRKQDLKLHLKVEDKKLYEHLFYSNKDWTGAEIDTLIDQYVADKK